MFYIYRNNELVLIGNYKSHIKLKTPHKTIAPVSCINIKELVQIEHDL